MIVPAVSKAAAANDRHRLTVEAMRTLIAIEMYRAEHGRLPERLDDLVPAILPKPPVDPMHGGAFVYRVDGDTYEFYSTGIDRTDDSAGLDAMETKIVRSMSAEDLPGTDIELKRVRKPRDP